ncbi:MAG: CoB--CoM heterodisulfide reductase subunit B [Candidatus Bathyarchaeota archaeon BA2]|nr:MAG: CoB--CoM heterodisulfide reductase subunit B [Candidatus Bathyarchaeota archaeon BA2]
MNRYAYFLGCITPNRYPGIELATRRVLEEFGIEVLDMEGASCCPAPGVFGSFDLRTWLTVAARNISIAEEMGADITVTCNGCYATIQEAKHLLKQNDELKNKVNNILKNIGREYRGTVEVKHIIEILDENIRYETIQKRIKHPLKGIKVAVHYGCHFLKPSDIRMHGTVERPTILDDFVRALGAESVDYEDKMMCCGAGGGVRAANLDVALGYTRRKIENMVDAEADCLITPCAFCHYQFDTGQIELTEKIGKKYELPVVFMTQLLGLALGMSSEDVSLNKNKTQIQTFTSKLS